MNLNRIISTVDYHTAGEPLRIVTGGVPPIPGNTILERRAWLRQERDDIRQVLMYEPRGHSDMYGAFITPPVTPDAHFGVIFMHNEGYSTMCGHGVIAVVTAAVELGWVAAQEPETVVNLDTPAGLVRGWARIANGRVEGVRFLNVPSFLYGRDLSIDTPTFGRISVDVIFGGAFYTLIDTQKIGGLRVTGENVRALTAAGDEIARATERQHHIVHPDEPQLADIYGTIITDAPADPANHSRNVCIFARSEVDRSPTGTGVSARVAALYAKGELAEGHRIGIESIIGTVFTGKVAQIGLQVGEHAAIVPEVSGTAYVTGFHQFVSDERDPFKGGFLLR